MERGTAIVTGGTSGIGLATARQLAGGGFRVAITGLNAPEDVTNLLHELGAASCYVQSDLSDIEQHRDVLRQIEDRLGPVSCLVNNAGIGSVARGDFLNLEPSSFDLVLGVNLRGTVFFTQKVVDAMLSSRSAGLFRSIINIGSISATVASPDRMDYCISKAALTAFTRNLAVRLAADGVSVFEVRPGIVRTGMTAKVTSKYDTLIENGLVPMKRWGKPADIAGAIEELASGSFAFATGSVINLDGGLSIPVL